MLTLFDIALRYVFGRGSLKLSPDHITQGPEIE